MRDDEAPQFEMLIELAGPVAPFRSRGSVEWFFDCDPRVRGRCRERVRPFQ
jgi:hypothetical protein